ncbi:MAG: hypothetical protein NTY60_02740 [Proteobacteria bacterium]|nr:hypothetical protein [Pseudomonadota bacterium]
MTKLIYANSNSILPVSVAHRTCPNCKSTYLDRVQRRVIDRVVGIVVPLKRYHCGSCGWEGNLKFNRE